MQYVEPVYSVWYNIWELQQTSYTKYGLLLFCTQTGTWPSIAFLLQTGVAVSTL